MRFSLDLEVTGPQFGPHEIHLGGVKVAVRDYDGSTFEEIAAEFCGLLGTAALATAKGGLAPLYGPEESMCLNCACKGCSGCAHRADWNIDDPAIHCWCGEWTP